MRFFFNIPTEKPERNRKLFQGCKNIGTRIRGSSSWGEPILYWPSKRIYIKGEAVWLLYTLIASAV